ncbi:hypothetical protein EG329_001372 [Mollisiaceae sp. DMI_Dod_QoI]|nr:hypothetical protein EG329_001372 [Helotiales sp. DMI_Dod_QoI]
MAELRQLLEFGPEALTPKAQVPEIMFSPTSTIGVSSPLSTISSTNAVVDFKEDSPMARFLKEPASTLPPNTPTKPRGMCPARKSSGSSPTPKSSSSTIKHERDSSPSPSPAAKRRATLALRPSPKENYDHWSPPRSKYDNSVKELFPSLPISSQRSLSARYERPIKTHSASSSVSAEKVKDKDEEIEVVKKKYPSLASVAVPGMGIGDELVCYNCGKKGHWFMDCEVACGRCRGDGHRTINCDLLGKGKVIKLEGVEELGLKKT